MIFVERETVAVPVNPLQQSSKAGDGLRRCAERGTRNLKGLPAEWELFVASI
jgi:hypothetical protein